MKNKMKETQSVIDVLYSDGKFMGVSCPVEHESETNIRKENEVIFCLDEAPEFQISVVARWGENALGEIVEQPDIYFRHISSGRLCQGVWACLGDEVYDQFAEEKWETLAYRLRVMLRCDLRRIVCGEKKYEIHPI